MSVHKAPRLLFFSTLLTTFIRLDRELLNPHLHLDVLVSRGIFAVAKIFFGVLRNEITLAWFGSVYAGFVVFFSKLFKRPSIIIVAGVDAAKDKEINYGIWLNPWKAQFVRYVFRHADRILLVDPFLGGEAARLAEYDGKNISYLPFGFDSNEWKPAGQKEPFILTVAGCENMWRFKKKGLDKLVEVAKEMPETQFVIIGVHADILPFVRDQAPPNVEIASFLEQRELKQYYQRAKVYCQVSFTEGMPNALCEAMLCCCIPVGTARGGIPTAIGDAGLLVPYGDVPATVSAFRLALSMLPENGFKARQRIIDNFPLKRREEGLMNIIKELVA